MDYILPMDVNVIKMEREETEREEELGEENMEIHAFKSEYQENADLTDEYEVNQENDGENAEPDLTDEELELPVPVTLPDSGVVIMKEEVLQDPLVDIPDSWICVNDESDLQDYNLQESSQSASYFNQSSKRLENEINDFEESELPMFSQESLGGDHLCIDSQQQWIEEAKQKVELHIQEVRRCRKLRRSNIKNVETDVTDTQNTESNMIVIVPDLCRVTDVPATHVCQQSNHYVSVNPVVTEIQSEATAQKYVLRPRSRPEETYGSEWDQWVREEKEKLEQHILEVRENRKRIKEQRLEEARIHRREQSLLNKNSHNNHVRKTVTSESAAKMELRVISKGQERDIIKGQGRGIIKGRVRSIERIEQPTKRVSTRVKS